MNFVLKVIKIFFRNKWKELKELKELKYPPYNLQQFFEFVGWLLTACVIGAVLFGIILGTGYVAVEWFHLSDVQDGDYFNAYGSAGMAIFILVGILFVVFRIVISVIRKLFRFIRWIWSNIKIAIAEAKK